MTDGRSRFILVRMAPHHRNAGPGRADVPTMSTPAHRTGSRHGRSDNRGRRVLLGLAVVVASVIPLATVDSAGAAPAPVTYLAVGDSYSSGQGFSSSFQGCTVDSRAWPNFVVAPGQTSPIWKNGFLDQNACSGATSADVLGQLDQVPAGVDLITVTVGANDIGLANLMTACHVGSCVSALHDVDTETILPGVESVLAKARATGATVVLATYPNLFARLSSVSSSERSAGVSLMRRLNASLEVAGRRAGVHVVDAEAAFAGHEPCGAPCPDAWVKDLTFTSTSYHLNAAGEAAYAALVSDHLASWTGSRTTDTLLPVNPAPEPIVGALGLAPAESCRTGTALRPLDAVRVTSAPVFAPGAPVTLSLSTDSGFRFKPPQAVATSLGALQSTLVLPATTSGTTFKLEAEGPSRHGTWTYLLVERPLDRGLAPCDQVLPTVQITSPSGTPTYLLNAVTPTVSFGCSDDRLLAACTSNAVSGRLSTAIPGRNTFVATARDWAGNTATASVGYDVRYVVLDKSPAWKTGAAPLPVSSRQSAVVHVRLVDANAAPVLSSTAVLQPEVLTGPCSSGTPSTVRVTRPVPASDGGVWLSVPPGPVGSCTSVRIPLADGTTQAWAFQWV